MRPLAILNCVGKALVRQLGNAVGFGVAGDVAVGVGEEFMDEWKRDKDEQQRRDEIEAARSDGGGGVPPTGGGSRPRGRRPTAGGSPPQCRPPPRRTPRQPAAVAAPAGRPERPECPAGNAAATGGGPGVAPVREPAQCQPGPGAACTSQAHPRQRAATRAGIRLRGTHHLHRRPRTSPAIRASPRTITTGPSRSTTACSTSTLRKSVYATLAASAAPT